MVSVGVDGVLSAITVFFLLRFRFGTVVSVGVDVVARLTVTVEPTDGDGRSMDWCLSFILFLHRRLSTRIQTTTGSAVGDDFTCCRLFPPSLGVAGVVVIGGSSSCVGRRASSVRHRSNTSSHLRKMVAYARCLCRCRFDLLVGGPSVLRGSSTVQDDDIPMVSSFAASASELRSFGVVAELLEEYVSLSDASDNVVDTSLLLLLDEGLVAALVVG